MLKIVQEHPEHFVLLMSARNVVHIVWTNLHSVYISDEKGFSVQYACYINCSICLHYRFNALFYFYLELDDKLQNSV